MTPLTFLPPDPADWLPTPVTLRLRNTCQQGHAEGTLMVGRMPVYVRGGTFDEASRAWTFAEHQHAPEAGFLELVAALSGRTHG